MHGYTNMAFSNKKSNTRARRWCFTVNNPTEEIKENLRQGCTSNTCKNAIIGMEVGTNGTPHLQGFFTLLERTYFTTLRAKWGTTFHFEMARGSDEQNETYCKKEGNIFLQLGEFNSTTTEAGGKNQTGVVLAELIGDIRSRVPTRELISNPAKCSVYARHAKVIKEIVRDLQQDDKLDELAAGFESAILKHWQNELNIYLKERPSERRVIWFTDVIGNTGKTWMSRYLLATLRENCIRLENSKSDNIKYAYNGERVVIFDFSRSQADHVNYEVIESVKNGIMFSGKYESCSKTFDIPHVVIFANFEPDLTKLSADRWDVRHFTEDDLKKTNRMSRDIDNKVEEAIVIDSSSDEPEVIDITETEVVNETTELYNPEFQDFFLEELEEYVQNMSTDVEVEAINENGNDTMRIFQMAEERTQKNSTPIEDNVFESVYGPLPNPP